ncbi:MAG: ribonuclease Y [Chlamydiales bacterium]|nr:ribonuclease Y [Chlamydiales bacterium]
MDEITIFYLWIFIAGAFTGVFGTWAFHRMRIGSYKHIANDLLQKAEADAERIKHTTKLSLKQKELESEREAEKTIQNAKQKLVKEEERLKQREDKLETRMNLVEKKLSDIDKREAIIAARKERIDEEKKSIQEGQQRLIQELERASNLSSTDAKALLIERISNEVRIEASLFAKRHVSEIYENAEQEATKIISTAINRISSSVVSDATISTVSLPSEELKGRIIGKEGRNIRALELATGINFIIDETPGAVILSGFDPIRKHIAKLALNELVLDGRIHPTRIEEAVTRAKDSVTKQIKNYGEDAALKAGTIDLHPELIKLLGKLKFRYSYGQNVLEHSLEVAHLMGIMAAELKLDVSAAKRIGLLHDIGKAVSHEVEGSHAIIGHDFALKYGESEQVANGIGSHHQEMQPTSIEASLCSAADALSAARPGARIEAIEHYVKRLQKLEEIAHAIPGVEKAYAMQAGKEMRIIVQPDDIDDEGLTLLARDVAKKIEANLSYPGKIKVVVIREKRAIEYAL